jgi:hypothetical protein
MSESLPVLEKDRSEVVRQITQLGDFRPGSILGVMGRCSKPNCYCAQAGDPGHGPNFRLTAIPSAMRIPPPTLWRSRPPPTRVGASLGKPGSAAWSRAATDEHFPGAVQIVDLCHTRQHLCELARKLRP